MPLPLRPSAAVVVVHAVAVPAATGSPRAVGPASRLALLVSSVGRRCEVWAWISLQWRNVTVAFAN